MNCLYLVIILVLCLHPVLSALSIDLMNGVQNSIEEGTRVRTIIFRFDVNDVNNDNNVICYVEHILPQQNTDPLIGPFEAVDFTVVYDPDNGFQLSTLLTTFYQLRLCCYEATQTVTPDPPTCSPIFVTVTKNNAPVFTSGSNTRTLGGDEAEDDFIENYRITDDARDISMVTLSLTTVPKDVQGLFKITSIPQADNAIIGRLTLAADARFIPHDMVNVILNATDGKDYAIFPIQVTLTDANSRPNIIELPRNITIREDTPPGTQLLELNFQDVDGFTVRIEPRCSIKPQEESFKFEYDTRRNALRLTSTVDNPLDFESNSFYNITCVITDGFLESKGEHLGITVTNINEPPIFQRTSQTCQLYESPAGESFCDVRFQATDPDNDAVTLSLVGNFSDRFALTDNNRRLTFAVNYDLEAISSPPFVNLVVVGSDPLGATGTTLVNVAIADVNDNDPVFTTDITTIPIEYTTARGRIGALTATDRDLGTNGDLTYSLVSISPPDAAVHFNLFNNGEIHYLSQFPDTLSATTALIVAKATDKGTPSRSATSTTAISFGTTTTTTTTTITTTTLPTTTTTTTTTVAPTPAPFDFWSRPENIAMFAILMLLFLLALLAALYFCLRLCLAGSSARGPGGSRPLCGNCRDVCGGPEGTCSTFLERCRSCDCDCDCCRPPRKIQPQIVRSRDYAEDFWNRGEHYESGKPFN